MHKHQRIFFSLRLSPQSELDFLFTSKGAPRQVSALSLSGLAQDCHVTGSPEFEGIHSDGFPPCAQLLKSAASTNSATGAGVVYYPRRIAVPFLLNTVKIRNL